MNCKKPQAPSVQAFRQDELQLFSPDSGAMLIYIMGRSAPLCATSLKGEIDCILLAPYLCLNSAAEYIPWLCLDNFLGCLWLFGHAPSSDMCAGWWQTQLWHCCTVGAGKKLLSASMYCGFAKDLFFSTTGCALACLGFGPTAQFFGSTQAVHMPTQETFCSTMMMTGARTAVIYACSLCVCIVYTPVILNTDAWKGKH